MNKLWGIIKRHKIITSILFTVVMITAVLGVQIAPVTTHVPKSSISIGQIGQKYDITIGSGVDASTTADYTATGTAAQQTNTFQIALNALPTTGGILTILSGNYTLNATITRAIPNVTIEGIGNSTIFSDNGALPIFTAGSTGWNIQNVVLDAGGISGTWTGSNITIGSTYYAVYGTFATGRTVNWTIAGSNASSTVLSQSDATCTGTGDVAKINAGITGLPTRTSYATIKLIGKFYIDSSINITGSWTDLDLSEAQLYLNNATTTNMITVTSGLNHIRLEGGYVYGNKAGQGGSYGIGILLDNVNIAEITGMTVSNFKGMGIYITTGSRDISVYDNWFVSNGTTGGDTALFSTVALQCSYIGNHFYGNQNDIGGQGLGYSTIQGNTSILCVGDAINLTRSGGTNVLRNNVNGNTIDKTGSTTGGEGIILNGSDYSEVSGNTILGSYEHGIDLDGSSYCTVSGNNISTCGWSGIVMYLNGAVGASNNEIFGNTIYECTARTGGDDSGIDVANSGCNYNNIHNNVIRVGTSTHQLSGIRVQSGAVGTIVIGNDLRASYYAGGQPLLDDGTSTVAYQSYSDEFMDLAARAQADICQEGDLSTSIPKTYTLLSQPSHPRTLEIEFTHSNITAYTLVVTGVNAQGQTVVTTYTEADGFHIFTTIPLSTVASIILTSRTGTGVGNICNVGGFSYIGLSKPIFAATDIYKAVKNGANYPISSCTIDPVYSTIRGTGEISAGDDWTVWYKVSLNILK